MKQRPYLHEKASGLPCGESVARCAAGAPLALCRKIGAVRVSLLEAGGTEVVPRASCLPRGAVRRGLLEAGGTEVVPRASCLLGGVAIERGEGAQ